MTYKYTRSLLIVVVLFLLIAAGALQMSFLEISNKSREQIQNYLSLWEDEIYQEQIKSSDKKLQNKIIQQIYWLDSSIQEVSLKSVPQCRNQEVFPLRFGVVQMESLYVCFSAQDRWVQALISPLFLTILFITFVVLTLMYVATIFYQWQIEKKNLLIQGQQNLVDLSKRVAHDIRSPMSVLNIVSVKLKGELPELADLISQVNQRIQTIASELLKETTAKTTALQHLKNPSLQEAELMGVLKEVEVNFDLQVAYHNYSKKTEWDISMSPQSFLSILSNILNNACESLDKPQKVVGVTVSERQGRLEVQIIDNGCGIESDKINQLWSEGPKENPHRSKSSHGIALPQAKKQLEAAGGSIEIISRPSEGTRVTLSLQFQH